MRRKHCYLLKSLLFITGVVSTLELQAQTINIPYQIGFEQTETAEINLRWHMNQGPDANQCVDKWVIGDAACNDGKQSLYISSDSGETCHFGTGKNLLIAYCDLILPDGNYYVSFDWRCLGTNETRFYAGMGRKSAIADSLLISRNNIASLPNQLNSFVFSAFRGGVYQNSNWKNTISDVIRVKAPNNELRLFFAWTSANSTDSLTMNIAPCIDNVQISNALSPIPTDLAAQVVSCDSVLMSWDGKSEFYEFAYRRHGSTRWTTYNDIPGSVKSLVLEGLVEGMYDFRVRGRDLDTVNSAWCCLNNEVVYCPENHCVNFVQLHDPNVCKATIGAYHNPAQLTKVVDYGSADMYSRHTVNMDHDMYDRRTNYQLPVIPPGELASVRLGNWNWHAECEALTFYYDVDAENAAILLLKYAIVMEDPIDHTDDEKPQFTLEILDQSGQLVDPTCGQANFVAGKDTHGNGWHKNERYETPVYWKEWTTIGLDLRQYDGQRIQIRLTTYDCWLQGHYGYAYFSLDCANAKIYSTSCGSDPEIKIDAPTGFTYQWFDNKNRQVPDEKGGKSQSLILESSDTTTYTCVLMSKETEGCGFSLSTASKPRYPYSDFDVEYSAVECQNKLRLNNKSHVIIRMDTVVEHLKEECEEFEWQLRNLDYPNEDTLFSDFVSPVFEIPNHGGRYEISLISYISNHGCESIKVDTFNVPKIGNDTAYFNEVICYGDYPLMIGDKNSDPVGKYYGNDTTVSVHWTSVTGCDSMQVWTVKTLPQSITVLPDTTICGEDSLVIDGERFMYTTSHKFVRFRKNIYDCDSTIQMFVNVLDSIKPDVQVKDVGETLGSGELHINGSGYDYYLLDGVRHEKTDSLITGLNGGIFQLEFFNDFGCSVANRAIMNATCLQMTFNEPPFICLDDDEWTMVFKVDSGIPTTYSIEFDSVAKAQNFVNQIEQTLDINAYGEGEFVIPIPEGAKPGIYHARLTIVNVLPMCDDIILDLNIILNFSKNLIFQRWDDVLSVYSSQLNGGFNFLSFQWMKDGQDIEGANLSYYYEEGGLDANAEYQVRVLTEDSVVLTTCAFTPTTYQKATQVKKVIQNQQFYIIINDVKYNALGIKVEEEK